MSKEIDIEKIIAWCDEQAEKGLSLELCWEGGGDSGWVYFELDEETVETEETEALVDMMYAELDYGSWAGEFSASGRAAYNSLTKCFEGIDCYSEEEWDTLTFDTPIEIRVPKSFGFDNFEFEITGNYDEDLSCSTSFHITNGFITPEISSFEDTLDIATQLKIEFKDVEVRYVNEHQVISRSEFEEDGDFLVYNIAECSYSTENEEENNVSIDLKEMLENINTYTNE